LQFVHESLYDSISIGIECYFEAPCGWKLGKHPNFVSNGWSVTGLKMFHVGNSLRARSLRLFTVERAEMKTAEGLTVVRSVTRSSTDGFLDFVYQITILNRTQLVEALCYKPEGRGSIPHRVIGFFMDLILPACRSAAARLLRLWVRIPPGAWMFVCCDCCVLSGRGLCDKLITRPEESY